MIKLAKKISFNKEWVDMGDGVEFKLDYPTRPQQAKLDELMMEMGDKVDMQSPLMLRYARLFIKYTVKDWKGIDEKCELVNNELKDDLWLRLTVNSEDPAQGIDQTTKLWAKISQELEFTESDKKK